MPPRWPRPYRRLPHRRWPRRPLHRSSRRRPRAGRGHRGLCPPTNQAQTPMQSRPAEEMLSSCPNLFSKRSGLTNTTRLGRVPREVEWQPSREPYKCGCACCGGSCCGWALRNPSKSEAVAVLRFHRERGGARAQAICACRLIETAARSFLPQSHHRSRALRSRTFAPGLSPSFRRASGVSSATWWQAAQSTFTKSPCQSFRSVPRRANVFRRLLAVGILRCLTGKRRSRDAPPTACRAVVRCAGITAHAAKRTPDFQFPVCRNIGSALGSPE
jgi:hypothetical protein